MVKQDFFAKPFEAITRAGDNTPQGAAAADQGDTDIAAIAKRHREEAAGHALPDELAPEANIPKPEEKTKRRFGEADDEADHDEKERTKAEKKRLKESDEYEKKNLDDYDKETKKEKLKEEKKARDKAAREAKAQQRIDKINLDFAKNPTGLTLHDLATQGVGEGGAKARQAEQEEALARNLQLGGNKALAAEHQSKAEQLKKELGLASKEDQKDSIRDGLDESQVLKDIRDNTDDLGANK